MNSTETFGNWRTQTNRQTERETKVDTIEVFVLDLILQLVNLQLQSVWPA
jgi:hypothetical protein